MAALAPGVSFDDGVIEDLIAALFANGGDGSVWRFGGSDERSVFSEGGGDGIEWRMTCTD